jgi:hypothetical protein
MILTHTDTATAYATCAPGTYYARCCGLFDLGTQAVKFEGTERNLHKLHLAFEIIDAENRRDDGAPFVLAMRLTASLHEKSSLRRILTAWRGRPFTPEELARFDMAALLGQPAMVAVGNMVGKQDGRTFATIDAVTRPPKGMRAEVEPSEPLLHFDLAAPNWGIFDQLPPRVRDAIALSPEYQRLKAQPKPAAASAPATALADMDDDIPF